MATSLRQVGDKSATSRQCKVQGPKKEKYHEICTYVRYVLTAWDLADGDAIYHLKSSGQPCPILHIPLACTYHLSSSSSSRLFEILFCKINWQCFIHPRSIVAMDVAVYPSTVRAMLRRSTPPKTATENAYSFAHFASQLDQNRVSRELSKTTLPMQQLPTQATPSLSTMRIWRMNQPHPRTDQLPITIFYSNNIDEQAVICEGENCGIQQMAMCSC